MCPRVSQDHDRNHSVFCRLKHNIARSRLHQHRARASHGACYHLSISGFPLSVGYPVVFQRSGPTLAQNQTGSLLHMQHCMRSCLSYLRRKEEVTPPVHPCRIRLDLSHAKLRELGEVFCPGDWDCVQGYCLNGAPAVLLLKIKIGMTDIVWYLKYEQGLPTRVHNPLELNY